MSAAFLLLLLLSAAAASASRVSPIPITVHYESLCPDSIRFINKKLVPAYTQNNFNFARLLGNLTLVPYGHVKVINAARYQYSCQHGQSECDGNKLHGCAVKHFTDKGKLLEYLSCLLSITDASIGSNAPYPVNKCQDLIPKKIIRNIINCYNSDEGWNIFNEHGAASEAFFGPTKYFIPYITFYNIKDDQISYNANNDFRNTLCSMYGLRSDACSDYN